MLDLIFALVDWLVRHHNILPEIVGKWPQDAHGRGCECGTDELGDNEWDH
jgi:hypothetical protein